MKQHNVNPWGVTVGQAMVLDAIRSAGSSKAAATRLGLSLLTVYQHTREVRRRMGTKGAREHHKLWSAFRAENPGVDA